MRKLIIIFLIFIQFQVFANMANPTIEGTFSGRPFVSQYVEVVHEDLFIKIDRNFEFAQFKVRYHINSSKDGQQIPFLFYASEYLDSFIIKIDGKEVATHDFPHDINVPYGTKFKDFSYFFESSLYDDYGSVLIEDSSNGGFYVNQNDMIYFETDISEGEHIIEVSYRATKWIDKWDWINEYSFRYALSPAKYWKSFGTLHVEIDATEFEEAINTNVGIQTKGNIDSVAIWHFDKLPTDILKINFNPSINLTTQNLIMIGPSRLAYITGIVLAIIHLVLLIWYRKRKPSNKFSIVVIIGSILIPLLFVISWVNYYYLIDSFIGEHASGRHVYSFFVVFLYPIILPAYWVLYWLIDKKLKKKYTRQ